MEHFDKVSVGGGGGGGGGGDDDDDDLLDLLDDAS